MDSDTGRNQKDRRARSTVMPDEFIFHALDEYQIGLGRTVYVGLLPFTIYDRQEVLGEKILMDGKRYTITGTHLFMHCAPWHKGEHVGLLLEVEMPKKNQRQDARRDANEPEIVRILQDAGYLVERIGNPGDLIVWNHVSRQWVCLEVKVIGGRLTPAQKKWRKKNPDVDLPIVRDGEQALFEVRRNGGPMR